MKVIRKWKNKQLIVIKKSSTSLLLLIALLALSSCGDSNNEKSNASENTDTVALKQSDIVGLWDFSNTISNGTIDEIYSYFDNNGESWDYDYLGDAFDQGDNCYLHDTDESRDIYQVNSDGSATLLTQKDENSNVIDEIDMTLTLNEAKDEMTITLEDIFDVDDDGDVTETLTITATRITTMTVADLTLCE